MVQPRRAFTYMCRKDPHFCPDPCLIPPLFDPGLCRIPLLLSLSEQTPTSWSNWQEKIINKYAPKNPFCATLVIRIPCWQDQFLRPPPPPSELCQFLRPPSLFDSCPCLIPPFWGLCVPKTRLVYVPGNTPTRGGTAKQPILTEVYYQRSRTFCGSGWESRIQFALEPWSRRRYLVSGERRWIPKCVICFAFCYRNESAFIKFKLHSGYRWISLHNIWVFRRWISIHDIWVHGAWWPHGGVEAKWSLSGLQKPHTT